MTDLTAAERLVLKILAAAGLRSKREYWGGSWVTYEELMKAAKSTGFSHKELFPDLLHKQEHSPLWNLLDKGYVESADYPTTWHGNLSVYRVSSNYVEE